MYKIVATPLNVFGTSHRTTAIDMEQPGAERALAPHATSASELLWTATLGALGAIGLLLIVLSLSPIVMMGVLLLLVPVISPILLLVLTFSYDGAETWVEENYSHDCEHG
jgi:hypothetical protein